MSRPTSPLLVLLLLVLAAGCGTGGTDPTGAGYGTYPVPDGPGGVPGDPPGVPPPPPPDTLTGGILLKIDSAGEVFHWWVTNPQTAQALHDHWTGVKPVISFGGVLRATPGAADHNLPWSWHVDPEQNGVDVLTVPEAPHQPSQCENQLAYWLSVGVVFIPEQATILELDDRR